MKRNALAMASSAAWARDRGLRMPFADDIGRLARVDEPLPPRGTTVLLAELSENVDLDLRTLPAHVRALLEANDTTSLDIAADWLEENGRIDGAELLRAGCALFVGGATALAGGYLSLFVSANEQLSIAGRGRPSAMRWPHHMGRSKWALLVDRTFITIEPALVQVVQPEEGAMCPIMATGRRVTGPW